MPRSLRTFFPSSLIAVRNIPGLQIGYLQARDTGGLRGRETRLDDSGGNPGQDGIWRGGALCHHGARCHDTAVADPAAWQDGGAAADPNIVPDGNVINYVISVFRPGQHAQRIMQRPPMVMVTGHDVHVGRDRTVAPVGHGAARKPLLIAPKPEKISQWSRNQAP